MAHQQRDLNRIFPIDIQTKVWYKQGKKCISCDEEFSLSDLQADHILEYSIGGPTSEENLQLLCSDCHGKKTSNFMSQKTELHY
jgi:5-methylcytosine-specific restriction endonuclease McrA